MMILDWFQPHNHIMHLVVNNNVIRLAENADVERQPLCDLICTYNEHYMSWI